MYDIIGDIHGHTHKLIALLEKMGYAQSQGVYAHPTRKVLFLGDYIDRGPQIRETLQIVRSMTEAGSAIALLGNHEYNALCFHFQESEGGHLRKHLIRNIIQHYETLKQFQNLQKEYEDYLEWFKTLPLFFENEYFRAVHATWDYNYIDFLKRNLVNDRLTDSLIHQSVQKGTPFYRAVDNTLKGRSIRIPDGLTFTDKEGTIRRFMRIKWWLDPTRSTYKELSVETLDYLPNRLIENDMLKSTCYYHPDDKPIFFGHYWLKDKPKLERDNICCLDYSVAKQGNLVAYRLDGEQRLSSNKLIYI
jgi:hypothetical protein